MFTGNQVNLPGPVLGNFVDGAVNGLFNYTLDAFFDKDTTVYRTNFDWTNPTPLFSIRGGNDYVGITFDTFAGNLWISDMNRIYQYGLDGDLLSQFTHAGGRGSLAYDTETDSLWY